jgi:hypothetical protein
LIYNDILIDGGLPREPPCSRVHHDASKSVMIDNAMNLEEHRAPEIPGDDEWHAYLRAAMEHLRELFAARRRANYFVASPFGGDRKII